MVGMEDGLLPHSRSLDDPASLEEERRLCYVGMTRAKERLYLVRAFRRGFRGGSGPNMPSRFLLDIPQELVSRPDTRRTRSAAARPNAGQPERPSRPTLCNPASRRSRGSPGQRLPILAPLQAARHGRVHSGEKKRQTRRAPHPSQGRAQTRFERGIRRRHGRQGAPLRVRRGHSDELRAVRLRLRSHSRLHRGRRRQEAPAQHGAFGEDRVAASPTLILPHDELYHRRRQPQRYIRNPATFVTVVTATDEDSAGSTFSAWNPIGTRTPLTPAIPP